jgi:DNA-binding GntR family transcriptional regulator
MGNSSKPRPPMIEPDSAAGPLEKKRAPERLTDLAIARIKEMIAAGKLIAGQRLPREQDLARELGLSRNSLRGRCAR